jgi:hypothetical protein
MNGKQPGRGRWQAAGGVVGPLAFVSTWAVLGSRRHGYLPVDDPISRLAALGSPDRAAMTAGFCAFGAGVGLYATALRRHLPGPAWKAALGTAIATIGVAAVPLGTVSHDRRHAVPVAAAYATLAALPLLGGRALSAAGFRRAGQLSAATSAVVASALVTSVVAPTGVGAAQRVGLTAGDVWIVASAVAILRGRMQRNGTPPS